jgi:hypothetical protein
MTHSGKNMVHVNEQWKYMYVCIKHEELEKMTQLLFDSRWKKSGKLLQKPTARFKKTEFESDEKT